MVDTDATLLSDLDNLIEPTTRGDPESPLRWTCKSTRKLARELKNMGHNISHMSNGRYNLVHRFTGIRYQN